ncbi:hypothetical protein HDV00_008070 [Rhizophlyctis rosea]|nr:hypothetical protein HDV00_008070 [Rhizophlyctis rosea]
MLTTHENPPPPHLISPSSNSHSTTTTTSPHITHPAPASASSASAPSSPVSDDTTQELTPRPRIGDSFPFELPDQKTLGAAAGAEEMWDTEDEDVGKGDNEEARRQTNVGGMAGFNGERNPSNFDALQPGVVLTKNDLIRITQLFLQTHTLQNQIRHFRSQQQRLKTFFVEEHQKKTSTESYLDFENEVQMELLERTMKSEQLLRTQLATLTQDLNDTQFAYDSATEKISTYEDVCESLQKDVERLRSERDRYRGRAKGAESEVDRIREEREELKRKLDWGSGGSSTADVEKWKAEVKRLVGEIEGLKKERDEAVEIAVAKTVEVKLRERRGTGASVGEGGGEGNSSDNSSSGEIPPPTAERESSPSNPSPPSTSSPESQSNTPTPSSVQSTLLAQKEALLAETTKLLREAKRALEEVTKERDEWMRLGREEGAKLVSERAGWAAERKRLEGECEELRQDPTSIVPTLQKQIRILAANGARSAQQQEVLAGENAKLRREIEEMRKRVDDGGGVNGGGGGDGRAASPGMGGKEEIVRENGKLRHDLQLIRSEYRAYAKENRRLRDKVQSLGEVVERGEERGKERDLLLSTLDALVKAVAGKVGEGDEVVREAEEVLRRVGGS